MKITREWHASQPGFSGEEHGSWHWGSRYQIGRVQFGYQLYKHCYYNVSDRWVFHPQFVYDRKSQPKSA